MSSVTSPLDTQTQLQQASDALAESPQQAADIITELLKQEPDNAKALHVLAIAQRLLGEPAQAITSIQSAISLQPDVDALYLELGNCHRDQGNLDAALTAYQKTTELNPAHAEAWRSLSNQLRLAGKTEESEQALRKHLANSTKNPELITAAEHLHNGELSKAETIIRDTLKKDPTDVSAIRLLADLGIKLNRYDDACLLLERCLQLAPDFHLARQNYATALMRRQKLTQALAEAEKLLAIDPNNPNYQLLKASILVKSGDTLGAKDLYENIFKHYPKQAKAQLSYGHILKTIGQLDPAIEAYKKVIELRPEMGEAYWSLANLKTFRFSEQDIEKMRQQVTEEGGNAEDQSHLAFALGKALEDQKAFDESFKYYKRGNSIRAIQQPYSPQKNMHDAARQIHSCSKNLFAQKAGFGCTAKDPIFIVGLPRAGSTLLEQILASHSQVEGTSELPDIIAISRQLAGKLKNNPAGRYPEILEELNAEQCQALGEGYINSTKIQRTNTPFFIDKMPNNFMHIGLIHLILPNAKIIDARRHPMAGCFAGFKQLFAQGQTFSYKLEDIGHYYRNYVKVMDHWDEVLPGRVHRVQYENMVADSETEIKKVLEYCGLPFEEQCLRFYETDRAIRTPSSEQVRQPIYQGGLEQWRNYEAHLDPLKQALGSLLERYPI